MYKTGGNIIHVGLLAATILYAAVVIYYTQPGKNGVIDQQWRNDGFCIRDKDVPYWSSFDTCLYVDVFFSIILGVLYVKWKDIPGMEVASKLTPSVIASTVGHGLAHGFMATKFRDPEGTPENDNEENIPPGLWVAVFAIFWFPLLKAVLPKPKNSSIALAAAVVTYGQTFCKKEFNFGYVQTIVNVAFSISQMMLSEQEKNGRDYFLQAVLNIAPSVTAWNEILFCEAYFRAAGGHTLYDASIILSFLAYYIDSYRYHTKNATKEKTN